MRVLNFGSLNIDITYRVPHIVKAGETLQSRSLKYYAGGKGANQSSALAKAGVEVFHAGKIGKDGLWLLDKLEGFGVNTEFVLCDADKTGHAVIQVSDDAENSIVLFGGGNIEISTKDIDDILSNFGSSDILLLQNEVNNIPYIIQKASQKGMQIFFNPAPFTKEIIEFPLELVDTLFINETEGCGLAGGEEDFDKIVDILTKIFLGKQIVLTLGEKGLIYGKDNIRHRLKAIKTKAVDTTSAGDTFIGFFIAKTVEGRPVEQALLAASKASAIAVSRVGAMDSIPFKSELDT